MLSEMGSLIERHGGIPYPAPVLQEVYLSGSPEVERLVSDVCQGRIDMLVLLTGVGTQALIESANSLGCQQEFLDSMNRCTVIARSPKPARVLRQNKIRIDLMPPEPFTSQDMVKALETLDLKGKSLAVQAYGGPNGYLTRSLREMGAEVREVTLYTWGLPEDTSQALKMIGDLGRGEIHALAFTSQPQVGNLLTIASQAGQEEALRSILARRPAGIDQGVIVPVVVGSIGPVCSRRLTEADIRIDVEPEHPHMGNLVMALGDHFQTGGIPPE